VFASKGVITLSEVRYDTVCCVVSLLWGIIRDFWIIRLLEVWKVGVQYMPRTSTKYSYRHIFPDRPRIYQPWCQIDTGFLKYSENKARAYLQQPPTPLCCVFRIGDSSLSIWFCLDLNVQVFCLFPCQSAALRYVCYSSNIRSCHSSSWLKFRLYYWVFVKDT
jgi:hypothetical protein